MSKHTLIKLNSLIEENNILKAVELYQSEFEVCLNEAIYQVECFEKLKLEE